MEISSPSSPELVPTLPVCYPSLRRCILTLSKNGNPKQLNVAIHRYIQRKPVQDAFAQMMAYTKPKMMKYKLKWGVNDVALFQVGYKAAVNKG